MVNRTVLMNKMRAETRIPREPMKIDRERLDQLPRLANRLRKECRGDHQRITKRLRQTYQFTAREELLQGDRNRRDELRRYVLNYGEPDRENQRKFGRSMANFYDVELFSRPGKNFPLRYPENIEEQVFETLDFFAAIEQKIMSELLTTEYIIEQCKKLEKLIE